jgi:hypothetical protein
LVGDGRLAQPEQRGDVAHAQLGPRQRVENPDARGVASTQVSASAVTETGASNRRFSVATLAGSRWKTSQWSVGLALTVTPEYMSRCSYVRYSEDGAG